MIERVQDGFKFLPMHYPFYEKKALKITLKDKSVEEYQAYIRNNNIEQAEIIMPDLKVLEGCNSLKHLRIFPSHEAPENFNFSQLYDHPEVCHLHCNNHYGDRKQYMRPLDYSKVNGLVSLSVCVNKGTLNYNRIESLKSLDVGAFQGKNRDLSDLFCSKELDTLRLIQCKNYSLNGIDTSPKIQCLYLDYNRSLEDISALRKVNGTIKLLRIDNCPNIQDFSVLRYLENLELLQLCGSNVLPNLDFLKSMKNLKTFIFSMNVLDGDISPCLDLSYAYSEKNRKHYNLKDTKLPKGKYVRGNENIEEWRRLE